MTVPYVPPALVDDFTSKHRRRIAEHNSIVKHELARLKQEVEDARAFIAVIEDTIEQTARRYQAWFSDDP
jgi:hypothetical protein